MRIVSLLPSATEIIYALGLEEQLVGVSHQCDYPPDTRRKPVLTAGRIVTAGLSSAQVDAAFHAASQSQEPPYRVDPEALRAANPDLVLTQELCEVCAPGAGGVFEVAAQVLPRQPQFVSLRAPTLEGLLDEIVQVGAAAGVERRARRLVNAMRARLERIATRISDAPRPRVLMLEWPDPPWCAGHWMADVALMPCGYSLERTLAEASGLALRPELRRLPALHRGRFYALDGTVTGRHGPRVVSAVEALASAFHPDRCGYWASPALIRRVTGYPVASEGPREEAPAPGPA